MSDQPFNIGDIVVPVVNLNSMSGEGDLLTQGISGTVINRSLIYTDPTVERTYYTYQVNLSEPIMVPSGVSDTGFSTIFWFSEEDLGNTGPFSNIVVIDAQGESDKFTTGQAKIDQALTNISQILSQMDSNSPYYDQVKAYLESISRHNQNMQNYSDVFSDSDLLLGSGKSAGKQGDVFGLDSDIFSELAENALGYHDVLKMIDDEFKNIEEQVSLQNSLAMEDDEANFTTYFNVVAKGNGQNVLVPGGDSEMTANDITLVQQAERQEFTDLITVSGLFGDISFPTGNA